MMQRNTRSTFRPCEHLRRRADFAAVFGRRCSVADEALAIHIRANELAWSRLGIAAPKRVGNAVRRNYLRRRIRDAFRLNKAVLPVGLDIVCVVRPAAVDLKSSLEGSFCALLRRAALKLSRPPRPPK